MMIPLHKQTELLASADDSGDALLRTPQRRRSGVPPPRLSATSASASSSAEIVAAASLDDEESLSSLANASLASDVTDSDQEEQQQEPEEEQHEEEGSASCWEESMIFETPIAVTPAAQKQRNGLLAKLLHQQNCQYESASDDELSALTDIPDIIEFFSPKKSPAKKKKLYDQLKFNDTPSIQFLSPKAQDVQKDYWYSRNDFVKIKSREKEVQRLVSKHEQQLLAQKHARQQQQQQQAASSASALPKPPMTPVAPSGPQLEGIETDAEAQQRRMRIQVTRAAVLLLQQKKEHQQQEQVNPADYMAQTCKIAEETSRTEAHKKALFLARHVRLEEECPEKLSAKYYTRVFTRAVPEESLERLKKSSSAGDVGRTARNTKPLARWGTPNAAFARQNSDSDLMRPRRRRSSMEDEELGYVRRPPRRMLSSEKEKLYGDGDGKEEKVDLPAPPQTTLVRQTSNSTASTADSTMNMLRMPQRRKSGEFFFPPPELTQEEEGEDLPGIRMPLRKPSVNRDQYLDDDTDSSGDGDEEAVLAAAAAAGSMSLRKSFSTPVMTVALPAQSKADHAPRTPSRRRSSVMLDKSPLEPSALNAQWHHRPVHGSGVL
jgi:hypothetical protein